MAAGWITVSQAADRIFGERSDRTTRAVQRMVALGADGPFPSAYKVDPEISNSVILIPVAEVEAYLKAQTKSTK